MLPKLCRGSERVDNLKSQKLPDRAPRALRMSRQGATGGVEQPGAPVALAFLSVVPIGFFQAGPDAVNLSFMISMVKSIQPTDCVEAMLVAQMVSVHIMAMRCAHHLANAEDIARHDSAARALGGLARTFPAQIEALNRYRNNGEPAITVQNVSVADGGKAFVGNVTQHANVIVSDDRPAPTMKVSMPDPGAQEPDPAGARGRTQA